MKGLTERKRDIRKARMKKRTAGGMEERALSKEERVEGWTDGRRDVNKGRTRQQRMNKYWLQRARREG